MTSASFDIAANNYDQEFTESLTGKLQRDKVWKYLNEAIDSSASLHVLELNCGTGEDALHFARKGHVVTATDISEAMLRKAQVKAGKEGIRHKVQFRKLDMADESSALWQNSFNMVFSNFGGINCLDIPSLLAVKENIKKTLKPGDKVILVVMPDYCLWEMFYFLLKGKMAAIFRRRKPFAEANVSGEKVKTWYYSPKKLSTLFGAGFKVRKVLPVGLFGPPSYLEKGMQRWPLFFRFLAFCEQSFARFGWQSRFADHFYMEIEVVAK